MSKTNDNFLDKAMHSNSWCQIQRLAATGGATNGSQLNDYYYIMSSNENA
jgi:hypothetical protein